MPTIARISAYKGAIVVLALSGSVAGWRGRVAGGRGRVAGGRGWVAGGGWAVDGESGMLHE